MSTLTAFEFIGERSEATPGLWNSPLSIISANIRALKDEPFTIDSGDTLSVITHINTTGGGKFQFLSIGSTPPSEVTTAAITIAVNSASSDYLYLVDSGAAKSNYIIGSRAGGTADGLNIWDSSADTMIASFSKQSIRFYQNVVGPVFDVGGALADTYNAATFIGSGSSLSGIQAAINQASIDGVARVYIPASMYPYSASSISFIHTIQMVREGGNWAVYDVRAYGARGDNTHAESDTSAIQAAIEAANNSAAANQIVGGFTANPVVSIPPGHYAFNSTLTWKSCNIIGGGMIGTSLVWSGSTRTTAIVKTNDTGAHNELAGIFFATESLTSRPKHWLEFNTLYDQQMRLHDLHFIKSFSHAIVLNEGWVNAFFHRLRFDSVGGYCIYSYVTIGQNQSAWVITDWTYDASHGTLTGPGVFAFDNIAQNQTSASVIHVGSARCESNDSLTGDKAFIQLSTATTGGTTTFAEVRVVDVNLQWPATNGATLVRTNNTDGTFFPNVVVENLRQTGLSNLILDGSGAYWFSALSTSLTNNINLRTLNAAQEATQVGGPFGVVAFDGTGDGLRVRGRLDTQNRLAVDGAGKLWWGSGSAVSDTNLYRSAVSQVMTDSALRVVGQVFGGGGTTLLPSYAFSSESSLGWYRSGASAIGSSYGQIQGQAGTALLPGFAISSESSLGWFRSAASTMDLSYGTLQVNGRIRATTDILAAGGFTNIYVNGGVNGYSGAEVHLNDAAANQEFALSTNGTGTPSLLFDHRATSNTGNWKWRNGSGAASLRLTLTSDGSLVVEGPVWGSGLSIGGTGTLIPAISSTSSKVAAFVVNGSSSSFTLVTWAAAKAGDQILVTIQPDTAVSSLSSGLVLHSHCTQNGQVELRLSNVSTLVQNQSSKTYYFTRISPF